MSRHQLRALRVGAAKGAGDGKGTPAASSPGPRRGALPVKTKDDAGGLP